MAQSQKDVKTDTVPRASAAAKHKLSSEGSDGESKEKQDQQPSRKKAKKTTERDEWRADNMQLLQKYMARPLDSRDVNLKGIPGFLAGDVRFANVHFDTEKATRMVNVILVSVSAPLHPPSLSKPRAEHPPLLAFCYLAVPDQTAEREQGV